MAKTYSWTTNVSGAWAYAGDWTETDTTPPTTPSATAPIAGDVASISGPTNAFDVLSGPGAAATFNVAHNVALTGGAFAFTNLVVGSSSGGGSLSIIGGGTVTANSLSIVNGQVTVYGSGSSLTLSNPDTLGGSYSEIIFVGAGATVTTGNISGTPSLEVDPTGTFEIGSAGGAATGALTIDAGFALTIVKSSLTSSAGTSGALIDNGTVALGAGTYTTLSGAVSGSGTVTIGAGATLVLDGTATGVGIAFAGAAGTMYFSTLPTATISGFTFGDAIRNGGTKQIGGVSYAQTAPGMGTLSLTSTNGAALGTLNLAGDYTGESFLATPGGVEVASGTTGAGAAAPSPGTSGSNYQWAITGGGDWGTASNWGTTIAPGINDTVVIAGGSSAFVVRGQGQSASLEIGQVVGLGGTFSTGALSLGQSATLVLAPGTTLTTGSAALVTADVVTAQGSGTLFQDSGVLSLFAAYSAGSTIQALGGATIQLASISAAAGSVTTLVVDPSSHLEIGTAGGSQAGKVTIDAGQAVQFNGYIRTGVEIDGSLELSETGQITGPVTGPGTLILDSASGYTLSTVASAIQFNGSADLSVTQVPTGLVTGFGVGDGLTFTGITFDQTQYSASLDTLTLLEDGSTVGTLNLAGNYAGDSFIATPTAGYGISQAGTVPPQTLLTVATGTTGAGSTPPSAGTSGESYVWTATSGDYGAAANYTANGNPATVAPGALDTVAITAPGNISSYLVGADDGEVVRGQGASAALTLTGNVVLGGHFTTGALSIQPPSNFQGAVVLAPGTSLTAASAVIGTTLDAAGAQVSVSGAVSGSGFFSASDGTLVQFDTASGSTNVSGLAVDQTSSIEIGGQGGAAAGTVTVDAGQVLAAQTIAAPLVLDGTLAVANRVNLEGAVSGTGTIAVAAGAGVGVEAAIGSGVTITLGAGAYLSLVAIGGTVPNISATIQGLTVGDLIYAGGSVDAATYAATAPGRGTLTLSNAGSVVDTLTLAGNYNSAMFVPQSGEVALAEPACFCAGTLIQTTSGEVPVEALQIGDCVITQSGAAVPIRWIGRRSYAGRFLAGRANLRPILIRAGALGDGLPRRDLRVSPCHAMAFDGVLVPARALVDGTTIVTDLHAARVEYLHIELDRHDIIFAEGAPSETFLDDDSRGIFHNAHEFAALYPDTAVPVRFCAPRMEDGHLVEAIRARLRRQPHRGEWRHTAAALSAS